VLRKADSAHFTVRGRRLPGTSTEEPKSRTPFVEGKMPLQRVHSFLVHPAKHDEEPPEVRGTSIQRRGQASLYQMLNGVFERAPEECDIDIVFRRNDDGHQQNDCRDLLVAYAEDPAMPNGRLIAQRLQAVTTHRSGLGLFFLMKGQQGDVHTLVVARFPADQGVIAHEDAREFSVEFVERVFMKSAKAYKSAIYSSDSLTRGFWDGRAVDRQISGPREISDYWIRDFLSSELRTTGPAGTRRLAEALKKAVGDTREFGVRHELVAAAALMRNQAGRRRSARQLIDQLGLSAPAAAALESAFLRPDLLDETFEFDLQEFSQHAPYRAVELDNGAMMIAEDARFAQVFRRDDANLPDGRARYVTEGRVVDERLRKQK
jgi:hypothetical protein